MSSKTLQSDRGRGEQLGVDYWRLFRDLPDPYILFEASDPEYRVIETNKAREVMTGVKRADCVGHPLFTIYPYTNERFMSTVAKNLRSQLKQVIRTGRSVQLDPLAETVTSLHGGKRTIYLQATYIPLRDASGTVRYILAVSHEVTDELHALELVSTAESRLAAALTIGKVGSWTFDVESQRIIGDQNFRKLFSLGRRHAQGFSLGTFLRAVHKGDRLRVQAAVQKSLNEQMPFEQEYRAIINNDEQRWVLARGKPEVFEGRQVLSGVVVDITEQRDLQAQIERARQQDKLNRRAARALQQRNEELEAIGRSKDEFVALASHQLRTPATAVKQYLGMVLQGYVGDISEDQAEVLTKAFESNERQIQIINQILSAARADTGRLVMRTAPLDLCALVQGIAGEMKEVFAQRQHTFKLHVPETPVSISGDPGYLRMAIENILQNASVYTPPGGTITLKLTQASKRCKLIVTDTGVGIKKSDLGKLFVKFSRIHNPLSVEAGGSGIGLYLAAEIVRLHGGEIGVDSHAGRGSTFAISLPLMQNMDITKQEREQV